MKLLDPGMASYLGWPIDYTRPLGEPAFAAPDSISWQVFKNPVALAVGGVCAVLLEFADARIRSGVWDHSTFKTDPVGRSKRTGIAAMVGVFGPQSAARRVIQGVTNMHTRVEGQTPRGQPYRALDPELLNWVSATASYGFLMAYHRFVRPLNDADMSRFFAEGQPVARLYGVTTPLGSLADFELMLARLSPGFESHPIITEFLDIMMSGRAAPGLPAILQRPLVQAAVDLLPAEVCNQLELKSPYTLKPTGRAFVKAAGQLADRLPDLSSPAAGAAQRLGLPADFVWKPPVERERLLAAAGYAGQLEQARQ